MFARSKEKRGPTTIKDGRIGQVVRAQKVLFYRLLTSHSPIEIHCCTKLIYRQIGTEDWRKNPVKTKRKPEKLKVLFNNDLINNVSI